MGLFHQALRLLGQRVAVDAGECEGIVGIVDGGGDEGVGAFMHQSRIGSEHQDDRARRIGSSR